MVDHLAGANSEPPRNEDSSFLKSLIDILGAITGAAALLYGLGLVIIFLSLYKKHIDTVSTTWYAASLAPHTLVGVYGIKGLMWPAAAGVVVFVVFVFVVLPTAESIRSAIIPEEQGPIASLGRTLFVYLPVGVIAILLVFYVFMYLPARDLYRGSGIGNLNSFGEAKFTELIRCADSRYNHHSDSLAKIFPICGNELSFWFWIYLGLIGLGSIAGIYLISRAGGMVEGNRGRTIWSALAILFAASYLGTIALSVPREPPLPHVALVENGDRTPYSPFLLARDWHGQVMEKCPEALSGTLLGHYDQFWYILDEDTGNVSAIPDDTQGLVAVPSAKRSKCESAADSPRGGGNENSDAQSQLGKRMEVQQREIDALSGRIDTLERKADSSTEAVESLRKEAIKLRQQLRADQAD